MAALTGVLTGSSIVPQIEMIEMLPVQFLVRAHAWVAIQVPG